MEGSLNAIHHRTEAEHGLEIGQRQRLAISEKGAGPRFQLQLF